VNPIRKGKVFGLLGILRKARKRSFKDWKLKSESDRIIKKGS